MSQDTINNIQQEPTLLGIKPTLEAVFKDPSTRPSLRTFASWKAQGFIPSVKIGKLVYYDPIQVRKAIDKRFTIEAID